MRKRSNIGAALGALLVVFAILPASMALAEGGVVRTTWPSAEDPGPPLYARVGDPAGPTFYNDGEWAAIVFYRDPECIPADFNLLDFFAFDSFGCEMTVSGFSLWKVEPGSAPPKILKSTGDHVPIWFVPVSTATQAAADGVLTIGELAGLDGLLVGEASIFNEVLQPIPLPPELGGGGHENPKLIQSAKGQLDDGHQFTLHVSHLQTNQHLKVIIDLG
jgi:hypothetical protein